MKRSSLIRLVDDDPAVLDSLSFVLRREGWEVAAYASGREFLVSDSPSVPGCLVLDYDMPEMNGLELQKTMAERVPHGTRKHRNRSQGHEKRRGRILAEDGRHGASD